MEKKKLDASPETIVVGMDFSSSSNRAFSFSMHLAKKMNAGVIAVFVKNYDDLALAIRQDLHNVNLRNKTLLAKEVDAYIQNRFESIYQTHGKNYNRIELVVVSGQPSREILRVARRRAATMISVGTRSRSPLANLVLGSTASKLVHNSFCPVIVVSAKTRKV